MKEYTFCYDIEKNAWRESHNPVFQSRDIASLPLVPIVTINNRRTGETWTKAWCKKHHTYEKILHCGTDGVTTQTGCYLEGLSIPLNNHIGQTSERHDDSHSVRWQVCHDEEEGTVQILSISARFLFTREQDISSGEFMSVPNLDTYSTTEESYHISEQQPATYVSAPTPVLSCALAALQEEACKIYGFPPKLLPPQKDKHGNEFIPGDFLEAFLHRPLDMSIFFFFRYFPNKNVDTLFPRNQAENFLPLAKALQLEPTEELRYLYKSNPLALILYLLLPELGIHRKENKRKFYGLYQFCGRFFPPLPKESSDQKEEVDRDFENLKFFCHWMLHGQSEEQVADHLLSMQKNWKRWMNHSLQRFRQYVEDMPADWKENVLQYGMTGELHDRLELLQQEQVSRQNDFHYGEKEHSCECKINDYNFRLISSRKAFLQIKEVQNGYLSKSTREEIEKEATALFLLERNGRYIANIWLQGNKVRSFCHEYGDKILSVKCELIFEYWTRLHGLKQMHSPRSEYMNQLIDKQKFIIEPIDRDAEWENMSLLQMLNLPESSIRTGYYLYLCRKLMECTLLCPADSPSLEDDEKEYLTRYFPYGKRIYDAAFDGNPEAQYAMNLLYREGICTRWPDLRLAGKWYMKALESGWLEIAPNKKDIQLCNMY